ncbi:unnamed protein product [Cuscuta epithymum]|uniref:Uncharacterized protein n=1 Tax=Cuscuta epithymum TaxID=186058 RepID=A0AAV0DUC9_9ASTE|nr:unnamed protein product [Cuscuta epithymum]
MDNKPSLRNYNVLILVVVCFLLIVLVGILAHHKHHKSTEADTEDAMIMMMMISPLPPSNNIMIRKTMRQHYSLSHHTHNSINYVSKRAVPKGPDPIHNHRVAPRTHP